MTPTLERAALVTLLKTATKPWHVYADQVEASGSALEVLEEERGLLAHDGLGDAAAEIAAWERSGIQAAYRARSASTPRTCARSTTGRP